MQRQRKPCSGNGGIGFPDHDAGNDGFGMVIYGAHEFLMDSFQIYETAVKSKYCTNISYMIRVGGSVTFKRCYLVLSMILKGKYVSLVSRNKLSTICNYYRLRETQGLILVSPEKKQH